ncbi:hypothetical protein E1212_16270 [Jiangella ureilytica]|uniref:Bacterial HORMA domain-containing protein n=1 Tax=Jiangella ureilytica TaxID=2530374 RepID=A0A4R4RK41_9ACTN|nr:hypothetical protein [Jiangella ureilytica]TDC49981.1 hypothetical protein E1212_16270 [Jiangella ureilytica]
MTYAQTQTFSRTEARYLASKVVADLHQCARLYGKPSASSITDYETELVERLVNGYVSEYEFGFKKNDKRVVAWQYAVKDGDLVGGSVDDRPGRVYARADISGASYYNYMAYTQKWNALSAEEKTAFLATLPFTRAAGQLPGDGSGYWITDKTYTRGGVAVTRKTFRPL